MQNNIQDQNSLGGANQAELEKICGNIFDVTPDNDVAPFDMEWHQKLSQWENGGISPCGTLTLIFSDTPQVLGTELGFDQIFHFGALSSVPPGVYLVGRSPNTNAWQIPNSGINHQADCALILKAKLGNTTAVTIGLTKGNIVFSPNGVTESHRLFKLDLVDNPLDDPTLSSYLANFTEEILNCPENRKDIWNDAAQWIPIEHAEKEIQYMLAMCLRFAFLQHAVLAETPLTNGRADLWIKSKNSTNPENIILELKTTRSKTSTGNIVAESTMINHLDEGVTQADQYRKIVGATTAYLCVYDMRQNKGGNVINVTKPKCISKGVSLKVFDIDNSSKSTRKTAASAS